MHCQFNQSIWRQPRGFLRGGKSDYSRNLNRASQGSAGFTLVEVVMSVAIVALVFGGIISAYIQSGLRLEWTGYSLAAESLAIQTIEQARSAVWDPAQTPVVNQLNQLNLMSTNYNSSSQTFTGYSAGILDIPYASTNYIMATNYVTIQLVSLANAPAVQVQSVRVDTVWPFAIRARNLYFTNTVCTLIAPDNRSMGEF
jgi:prepilin-type N-terminal cleavage/methylation domain-containing protein